MNSFNLSIWQFEGLMGAAGARVYRPESSRHQAQ